MTVTVKIENFYEDGHESRRLAVVPAPADLEPETLQAWWDEVVFQETGDGHGDGRYGRLGSCYVATVIGGPLDGAHHEWGD